MSLLDDLIHRGESPPTEELADLPAADVPPGNPDGTRTRRTRSDKGQPRGPRGSGGRRPSTARIREQVAALVAMGNLFIDSLSPADTLSDDEMNLMADALTAECSNSTRIMKWMGRASGVSAHFLLLSAIVTIAIPRLQRRGILPQIGGTNGGADTPVPMATGGAYGDNRWDGQRENDSRERPHYSPFAHAVAPLEARQNPATG